MTWRNFSQMVNHTIYGPGNPISLSARIEPAAIGLCHKIKKLWNKINIFVFHVSTQNHPRHFTHTIHFVSRWFDGLWSVDTCPLCKSQSLPHLLITCCESINFWALFTRWWRKTFHQNLVLSEKEILYGWLQNRSSINFTALNYSLIIAKYHIFASSIRVGSLDLIAFFYALKTNSLAVKNKELDQFKETWAVLL